LERRNFNLGRILETITTMRKKPDIYDYLEIRISQLSEDMRKAHDEYDKQWYNRLIQELSWAHSQKHNCYMEK